MTIRCATLLTIVLLLLLPAAAQTNTVAETNSKDNCPTDTLCITKDSVASFEPSILGRFGRMWQYQYQFAEQPSFLVVALNGSSEVIPNPEAYLQQHQLNFQLSELVPNTSNLASIVKGISSTPQNKTKKTLLFDKQLCPGMSGIECMAAGGNFWQRFIAGVSGNASLSERDEVQQGVLTTQSFSLHYGPAGEVDFDPSSLFITGTSWKTAVTSLPSMTVPADFFADPDEAHCFMKTAIPVLDEKKDLAWCVNKFASARLGAGIRRGFWTGFAATIIPKFTFKATDQYDFIKNGGVLIPAPGLQRSLKSYVFTWDFRHIIPSTADRLAVVAAYKAYSIPTVSEKVSQPKVCVTMTDADGTNRAYIPVADSFTPGDCQGVASKLQAKSYALACASSTTVNVGLPNDATTMASSNVHLPDSNACNW